MRKGLLLRGVFAECANTFRRRIHLRTGERAKSDPPALSNNWRISPSALPSNLS